VTREPEDAEKIAALIGIAAVSFSLLYFVSDLIELTQGGFSTLQLALTYAAEAAIPLFVLGLYAEQRPQIGPLGLVGALTYAYTFVFFTSTVVYALVNDTSDWNALKTQLGAWVTVHSVLMILAGVTFGAAVARAHVLPRWTGITLIVGMVLISVTAGLPDATHTVSAGVRDLAFAGMGASLLRNRRRLSRPSHEAPAKSRAAPAAATVSTPRICDTAPAPKQRSSA
jgi:hypothetical protein